MMRIYYTLVLGFMLSLTTSAQTINGVAERPLPDRVMVASESIFIKFREAGMNPVNHELTALEKAKVEKAFAFLPPLHQQILKKHLHSISFMDSMPNTALTSPVNDADSQKLFTITFRAGILNETISEWATQKEYSCYDSAAYPDYHIRIEAGEMDAMLYVLLHEATHVVDAVLNITPHVADRAALVEPTSYIKNIWYKMNIPVEKFTDTLLEKTRFRSGRVIAIDQAPAVYKTLGKTPFPSLYAMASWFEDLAELTAIYHLTDKLNQPFRVIVRKNNTEVARFEPMKNRQVKRRLKQLKRFYLA